MRNLFLNGKKCWKKELENLKEENKKKTSIERNKSEMEGLMELSFLTTEQRRVGRKTNTSPPPPQKKKKTKNKKAPAITKFFKRLVECRIEQRII